MNIEYLAEISDDTLDEKDNAPFPIVVDNNNHRVTPYIDLIINSIHYIYEEIVAESTVEIQRLLLCILYDKYHNKCHRKGIRKLQAYCKQLYFFSGLTPDLCKSKT